MELQSFLGLTNYYRNFMQGCTPISTPLHHLTEKRYKKNLKWETEHETAFSKLKILLYTEPLLALPNFTKRHTSFKIDTDASDTAIGAVLSQCDDHGHERVKA